MPNPNPQSATTGAAERPTRGHLKIFLGFAPGVGKTYAMLDEAHRRNSRGQNVMIALIDPRGRKDTLEQMQGFEKLPAREVDGRKEVDVDAVIARHPSLVLIDDLAFVNAPGGRNPYRWQDIEDLLNAGISVLTTMDVQHLESLNDHIEDITGIHISNTVPDHVLKDAEEVEMVDLTPRALLNRIQRGDVFESSEIPSETAALFREGNLSALREIALREIAGRVDVDVEAFRKETQIEKPWATHDRVMICISPSRPSLRLVRRGWRTAQKIHADVVAVYVEEGPLNEKEQKTLRDDFALAERLGIPIVRLQGDAADAIIEYAQKEGITEIVIGHSDRTKLSGFMKSSLIHRLARELRNIDILVVAAEPPGDNH